MIDCPRSNCLFSKSLPLSFLSLLFLLMQFAQNANAQTLSDRLQFVAVARNESLAIDKLKFVGQQEHSAAESAGSDDA